MKTIPLHFFLARIAIFCLFSAGVPGIPKAQAGVTLSVSPSGTPYSTIQGAIDAARDGDTIQVYPGTYYETIVFSGKAITLESTKGADITVIDGGKNGPVVTFQDNETRDSVIQGFTITNGRGYWGAFGGGIFCAGTASPRILDNILSKNTALHYGGGICCYEYASPEISGNVITHNTADEHGGGIFSFFKAAPVIAHNTIQDNTCDDYGGGICCFLYVDAQIIDNLISGNHAGRWGGGIFGYNASPDIRRNKIFGNSAGQNGGGIALDRTESLIVNCMIAGNAAVRGGGVWIGYDATPFLLHNTLTDNLAEEGHELWSGFRSLIRITNSIVWNLAGNMIYNDADSATEVSHSTVFGHFPGPGNIGDAPLFANPDQMDFHLTPNSPGIDKALHASEVQIDFECDSRPLKAGYDMGADEFRPAPCMGNADNDTDVDISDFAIFAADFGRTDCERDTACNSDFDGDGDVDVSDFAIFAANFGRTDCLHDDGSGF
ncbi:right-handed parallel beta-helix repeat-containing protein [Desulfobacter latus]|uniref:Probable pectate lyase C n=1 Tax=Desulfobacter latus TaxID=2292 RepID=A0A850SUX8_9BACT|nr:NosD domain-containing protein [Desulfobacter latus]NWH03820.1 DUF1565 domain-containing protein [Desulfobacter latus]